MSSMKRLLDSVAEEMNMYPWDPRVIREAQRQIWIKRAKRHVGELLMIVGILSILITAGFALAKYGIFYQYNFKAFAGLWPWHFGALLMVFSGAWLHHKSRE